MGNEYDFDVAVSFAGENRAYVDAVVAELKVSGHRVFYDEDNDVDMWGRDLTEYFAEVYEKRARYAIMFVSAAYARKSWTISERRHILARAVEQVTPYALPVRLDSTMLDGLRPTIAYLDGSRKSPQEIADAIRTKLGAPAGSGHQKSPGLTPIDESEAALLLGERPPCWEYTYFAWRLRAGVRRHEDAYNDYMVGYTHSDVYKSDTELLDYVRAFTARQTAAVRAIDRMLGGPAQEQAFGAPGDPGNPDLIEHLAARLCDVYRQLIDAANSMRSTACESEEGYDLVLAVAEMPAQPIKEFRDFVETCAKDTDAVIPLVLRGETVSVTLLLRVSIAKATLERVDAAIDAFGSRFS